MICLVNDRDTTVLPCRHMCMCHECAQVRSRRERGLLWRGFACAKGCDGAALEGAAFTSRGSCLCKWILKRTLLPAARPQELRKQTSKCPICRNHVESLLHIKMHKGQKQGAAGAGPGPGAGDAAPAATV